MKKSVACFVGGVFVFIHTGSVQADPMDLSSFVSDVPNITVIGNSVNFDETDGLWGRYFANDSFFVDNNALSLTFDYTLSVGSGGDNEDYLVAIVNYTNYEFEVGGYNSSLNDSQMYSGSYTIDLSVFQGQTISLAFGLEAGWEDWGLSTLGGFSNFDITMSEDTNSAPVPEPATMLLFGTGLAGVYGANRKRKFVKSSK